VHLCFMDNAAFGASDSPVLEAGAGKCDALATVLFAVAVAIVGVVVLCGNSESLNRH
jgi:hypothetical protein